MIRNFVKSIFITGLIFCTSCGKKEKPSAAEKFLDLVNNYQADRLRSITAEGFQLKRTFTSYTNNRASFLEEYLPYSKNFNGKYKIISSAVNGDTTNFLTENQSDYFKYLGIGYAKLKLKIVTGKDDKVVLMLIDTTEGFQKHLDQNKEKSKEFESWLNQKHPGESNDSLYNTPGLLIQRLKEYAGK